MKYSLTLEELLQYREAFATCAIEGNEYAEETLRLWKTDRRAFIVECLRLKYAEVRNEDKN